MSPELKEQLQNELKASIERMCVIGRRSAELLESLAAERVLAAALRKELDDASE